MYKFFLIFWRLYVFFVKKITIASMFPFGYHFALWYPASRIPSLFLTHNPLSASCVVASAMVVELCCWYCWSKIVYIVDFLYQLPNA